MNGQRAIISDFYLNLFISKNQNESSCWQDEKKFLFAPEYGPCFSIMNDDTLEQTVETMELAMKRAFQEKDEVCYDL